MAIVGGQNINVFTGFFTATATQVGGAYISGTAEIVYLPSKGLLWVQAPVGFALSLVVGGYFFVNPMRSKNYVTVMDPIQETYENMMGSLLFIPPVLRKVFCFAAILASLGATMRVILNIEGSLTIIVSACTVLGSIPWQTYFQRVLSAASTGQTRLISYISGFRCFATTILSVLIGAVAASTAYISIAGLGAIAAATMSSADSVLLSVGSVFAHNIYKKILRKKATEIEVLWAMRTSMLVFGAGAASLAFYSISVHDLWFLSRELVHALLFPQLCCALFAPSTKTYGSAAGFLVGLLLRLLAGEPALSIPPVICYPVCSLVNGIYSQVFPFKTFTILLTFSTILAVSYLAKVLFQRNLLPHWWDVCNIIGGTGTLILLQQMEKQRVSPTIALEENRG